MAYVAVGTLYGVEFKVKKELAENIMFRIEFEDVIGSAEAVSEDLAQKVHLKEIAAYLTEFKKDIKRGWDKGDFEPKSAEAVISKADELIATAKA